MTQLVIELPDEKAKQLAARAKAQGVPLEEYVSSLLSDGFWVNPHWPEGYFERVVGSWQGEPLEREPQGEAEEQEPLF